MALKIAVIGMGQFGRLQAEILASLEEFDLVGVANRAPERFDEFARGLGLGLCHADLDSLLRETQPDAVVVATRTDTHAEFARQSLAAGCNVYLEKPAARNETELLELIAAEENSGGKKVMVSHVCLFHSLIGPLCERIMADGFRHIRFVRHRPDALAVRFAEETPVRMTMVHDLYMAARFVGDDEPKSIDGWHKTTATGGIDMSWGRMEWDDGRSMIFESFWTIPSGGPAEGWDYIEVFGSGWYAKVNTNPAPLEVISTGVERPVSLEISTVEGRPVGMLAEAFRSFAAACRGREVSPGCRLQDSLRIERWMERILS